MKSFIFVLCLCVTITIAAGSWIDKASVRIARDYNLPVAEVKACFIETNINLSDALVTAMILTNQDTSDVQDSALKVGCLFACMFKKKEWMDGTTLKIDVLKEESRSKLGSLADRERSDAILDTCFEQVKNLSSECEVMLNYLKCMIAEWRASI